MPAPITPPTMECVVETGAPTHVARLTQSAPARRAAIIAQMKVCVSATASGEIMPRDTVPTTSPPAIRAPAVSQNGRDNQCRADGQRACANCRAHVVCNVIGANVQRHIGADNGGGDNDQPQWVETDQRGRNDPGQGHERQSDPERDQRARGIGHGLFHRGNLAKILVQGFPRFLELLCHARRFPCEGFVTTGDNTASAGRQRSPEALDNCAVFTKSFTMMPVTAPVVGSGPPMRPFCGLTHWRVRLFGFSGSVSEVSVTSSREYLPARALHGQPRCFFLILVIGECAYRVRLQSARAHRLLPTLPERRPLPASSHPSASLWEPIHNLRVRGRGFSNTSVPCCAHPRKAKAPRPARNAGRTEFQRVVQDVPWACLAVFICSFPFSFLARLNVPRLCNQF